MFKFLASLRFWALVGIAITGVLKVEGILTDEIGNAIITILFGYTSIRTIDRFSEQLGK